MKNSVILPVIGLLFLAICCSTSCNDVSSADAEKANIQAKDDTEKSAAEKREF